METLTVGSMTLDVRRKGTGRPIVYLHAEQFVDRTEPFLNAMANTFQVIAPRHPGYGATPLPPDCRTVDDLAYLYLDLLDQLDLQDVTLVGASFGGWIALEMAVRNCSRLAKVALISTVGVKLSGREERDFADIFFLPDSEAFPALFADPKRWAPDYASLPVSEVEALARERQTTAFFGWKPYLHKPGLQQWLHRVKLPTLVLWGEQDRFATPAYGRRLAERLPKAEFKLVSDAGHYPQIEQAEAVVCAIAAFASK